MLELERSLKQQFARQLRTREQELEVELRRRWEREWAVEHEQRVREDIRTQLRREHRSLTPPGQKSRSSSRERMSDRLVEAEHQAHKSERTPDGRSAAINDAGRAHRPVASSPKLSTRARLLSKQPRGDAALDRDDGHDDHDELFYSLTPPSRGTGQDSDRDELTSKVQETMSLLSNIDRMIVRRK